MPEFELDNTREVEATRENETHDASPLKHELDEFADLAKKDSETDVQLPAYLREIEANYASPKVANVVTDMVDSAYSEINTKAYNRFWPDFLKESDEFEPAPFNKDGELPIELEQHFELLKGNLNLEFENEKMQILSNYEKRFTRGVGNILAKNEVYQRLNVAYTQSMEAESEISPEKLYEYQKENRKIVEDFATEKANYLEAVSRQYDRDHLGELTDALEMNSHSLVNDVIQAVENKVAPTKIAIANAISPEISKSTIPLMSKMVANFDSLEISNDAATEKAIEDFKRRVRRDMRRARNNDIQIHVDEYKDTSKALHDYVEETPEVEATTPAPAPAVEEHVPEPEVKETEGLIDPELEAVLKAPVEIPEVEEPAPAPAVEEPVVTPEPKIEEPAPVVEEPKVEEQAPDVEETPVATHEDEFDPFASTTNMDDIFGAPTAEPKVEEPKAEEPAPAPVEEPKADELDPFNTEYDPFSIMDEPTPAPAKDNDIFADFNEPTETPEPAQSAASDMFDPFEGLGGTTATEPETPAFDADNTFASTGLGETPKTEEEPTPAKDLASTFDSDQIFAGLI